MKRSEVNAQLARAQTILDKHGFLLPSFAHWTPDEWRTHSGRTTNIIERGLGWDITDFGSGRFPEIGLTLFTLRNGASDDLQRGLGMLYAEKIMIVEIGQVTPMHFHWAKTEDIINRGGGQLAIRLFNATDEDELATEDVGFLSDGIQYSLPAGSVFKLEPGASITLTPRLYHSFWAEHELVLTGEVSTVNDDERDNHFLDRLGRFASVEEDEPAASLLVSDYVLTS